MVSDEEETALIRSIEVKQGEVVRTWDDLLREASASFSQFLKQIQPDVEKLLNTLDPDRNAVESDSIRRLLPPTVIESKDSDDK